VFDHRKFRPGPPPSSWVHLGSITLRSGSRSCLGAVGVGMIDPVLEKAPDFDMNLASAATPFDLDCTEDCG
jgi:hypothetical protein